MDGVVLRECLKATEPLWGDSFFFTTKFLEIHGTHFIDLRKIKAVSISEPACGFGLGAPGLGIQCKH